MCITLCAETDTSWWRVCCEEQANARTFSMKLYKTKEMMRSVAASPQGKGTKRKLKPEDGSAIVHKWRKERLK